MKKNLGYKFKQNGGKKFLNAEEGKIGGKDFWKKDLGIFFVAKLSFCRKSEISSDVITNETKGNPFTFSCVKSDKQTNRQTDKLLGSIVCQNIGHSSGGKYIPWYD